MAALTEIRAEYKAAGVPMPAIWSTVKHKAPCSTNWQVELNTSEGQYFEEVPKAPQGFGSTTMAKQKFLRWYLRHMLAKLENKV